MHDIRLFRTKTATCDKIATVMERISFYDLSAKHVGYNMKCPFWGVLLDIDEVLLITPKEVGFRMRVPSGSVLFAFGCSPVMSVLTTSPAAA
jgi:hypothetical protein